MNNYKYEELSVGHKEEFKVVVSEEYHREFSRFTGDINPLHIDKEFALKKGYQDQVVFGMLTSSYYSTLAGVYLPGERSVIYDISIKFLQPVYIGDTLTIEGVIDSKSDLFKIINLKCTITNQDDIKVSKAKMKIGVK